jgi:hypothetical protein
LEVSFVEARACSQFSLMPSSSGIVPCVRSGDYCRSQAQVSHGQLAYKARISPRVRRFQNEALRYGVAHAGCSFCNRRPLISFRRQPQGLRTGDLGSVDSEAPTPSRAEPNAPLTFPNYCKEAAERCTSCVGWPATVMMPRASFWPGQRRCHRRTRAVAHPDSVYCNVVQKYGLTTGASAQVNGLCVHSLRTTVATNTLFQ